MIYPHRLYAIIGKGQYCARREHLNWNYPGCPYNKPGQKIHPRFIDVIALFKHEATKNERAAA
jgi:hypothetical protein